MTWKRAYGWAAACIAADMLAVFFWLLYAGAAARSIVAVARREPAAHHQVAMAGIFANISLACVVLGAALLFACYRTSGWGGAGMRRAVLGVCCFLWLLAAVVHFMMV